MKETNDYLEDKYPIPFNGSRIRVEIGKYQSNNATSIQLFCWDEDMAIEMPYATATVNVEHANISEDEVVIKTWSENEGILPMLVKEGIVAKPHETVQVGYTIGYICQLIE